MSQVIKATKNALLVLALVFSSLLMGPYFSYGWHLWQGISLELTYLFAAITFVLSAQFSRSRLSWLALFLCFLSLFTAEFKAFESILNYFDVLVQAKSYLLPLENEHLNSKTLLLLGSGWLTVLACSKDRGILSLHSLSRVLTFIAVILVVNVWVFLIAWVSTEYKQSSWFRYLEIFEVFLPLVLCGLIIMWQAVKSESLVLCAIIATFVLWWLSHLQITVAPWMIIINVLLVMYVLVVLIDSYFLAYRDELTSLPSRRALKQLSLSLGKKYTLAMMDIDHFKKFNDKYGHDIGDQVLKLVESKLTKVKGGGKVFRYGGEEFTVVFPRKDVQHAAIELEKLRQSIADYKMIIRQPVRKTKESRGKRQQTEEKSVSVTISIGVAARVNGQKFDQALKSSDEALYRAKKSGRNNVSY